MKERTLTIGDKQPVDVSFPSAIFYVCSINIDCRWLIERLGEILLALTLVIDGLDESADDGWLALGRTILKPANLITDNPLPRTACIVYSDVRPIRLACVISADAGFWALTMANWLRINE